MKKSENNASKYKFMKMLVVTEAMGILAGMVLVTQANADTSATTSDSTAATTVKHESEVAVAATSETTPNVASSQQTQADSTNNGTDKTAGTATPASKAQSSTAEADSSVKASNASQSTSTGEDASKTAQPKESKTTSASTATSQTVQPVDNKTTNSSKTTSQAVKPSTTNKESSQSTPSNTSKTQKPQQYSTSAYRKHQAKLMVLPKYQQSAKKAWTFVGAKPGSNQPVTIKKKYQIRNLMYLTVDAQMKLNENLYYHFKNENGQNAWIWQGYTQKTNLKYAASKLKRFNKKLVIKQQYKAKNSDKYTYIFDVHESMTNYKRQKLVNTLSKIVVDQQMVVNHKLYYHITNAGKNNSWLWHGYTTTPTITKKNYLEKDIKKIMNKYHLKGKVLVVNGNKSNQDVEGVGYANHSKKTSNNAANVIYPGASLQKAMTGAMMVQIITESQKTKHKIYQTTSIKRWYPNLKGAANITVGNLLTQTSGIVDSNDELDPGYKLTEAQAVSQTVQRINQTRLANQSFHYSNDNYILLAGIIRAYTGKSYAYNLQKRIIKPLNLKHTFMWNGINNKGIKAKNYQYKNGDYKSVQTPSDNMLSYILGAGNMYTTPDDYFTFQKGLQDGKILNMADYNYLTNLHTKSSKGYSGGMYIRHKGKIKAVYGALAKNHIGNWVQLIKNNGQGIILFANQSNGSQSVKQAAYEILSKISKGFDKR